MLPGIEGRDVSRVCSEGYAVPFSASKLAASGRADFWNNAPGHDIEGCAAMYENSSTGLDSRIRKK